MDTSGWHAHQQTLASHQDDDFQQFLDMGGLGGPAVTTGPMGDSIQFDFHDFQSGNGGPNPMMQQSSLATEAMDTHMGGTESTMTTMAEHNAALGAVSTPHQFPMGRGQPIMMQQSPVVNGHDDSLNDLDAQIQFLQQKRLQQQAAAAFYTRQGQVPPTPQSLDMPPNSGHFYRYQRMNDQQDMAFTPLVSPAVTPLDSQYQLDLNFTVSGAYFSPLTSPALLAQSESNSPYDQQRNSMSSHNSPGEMELENTAPSTTGPVQQLAKAVRKNNASRAKGAKSSVRRSPITKPQKKKTVPTPKMVSQVLSEVQEAQDGPIEQALPQAALGPPLSSGESENASVSPETLSDMPPPPPPPRSKGKTSSGHAKQSKAARQRPQQGQQQMPEPSPPQPQQQQATPKQQAVTALPQHVQGKPSPATPASLMRLPSSSASGGSAPMNIQDAGGADQIEAFTLPESVNFTSGTPTPTVSTSTPLQSPTDVSSAGGGGASFQPLPSPVFHKPDASSSASASPNLAPGSTGPGPKKTPQLAPRGSKKRSSVSSVHISPALRPKISPHIKPLLPGTPGMTAADSASHLLMSKSNYQNILEGNSVPGVSYPDSLSTNLTSKRTSHKIAEQGRRNRINVALQEMATLLPKTEAAEGKPSECEQGDKKEKEKEKEREKATSTPSSKASTVELAIDYIKQLQKEVSEANARAQEAENKLKLQQDGLRPVK